MESLLVNVGHGRAGDIKNVVAVGDSDRLPTDETKIAKCFTWFWITVAVAGSFILVMVLVVILVMVVVILSLFIILVAVGTVTR